MSRLSSTPPLRRATVRATPIDPSRLRMGVPRARVAAMASQVFRSRESSTAMRGEMSSKGSPVSSQWAVTLARASRPRGWGISIICSRAPSAKSSRNSRSRESMAASRAATQMMPGAMRASSWGSGPIPRGKRVMTMRKNQSGLRMSARWRNAISSSRRIRVSTAFSMRPPWGETRGRGS